MENPLTQEIRLLSELAAQLQVANADLKKANTQLSAACSILEVAAKKKNERDKT